MIKKALSFFSLIMVCLSINVAHADDDVGLYAPKAPPGSNFVRFFNASDGSLSVTVDGASYGTVRALKAGAYTSYPRNKIVIGVAGRKHTVDLGADSFYTVVIYKNGNYHLYKDDVPDEPTKALVALYNVDHGAPLSLMVRDETVMLVDSVPIKENGFRGINAAKIDFSVTGADGVLLYKIPSQTLERGRSVSVFCVNSAAIPVHADIRSPR